MKTILLQFINQKKYINNVNSVINRLLHWVHHHPAMFLWLIWTSYLCLDISATFLLGETISSYGKMLINYMGGGILNQFWFFVVLPNLVFGKKWKLELVLFLVLVTIFFSLKITIDYFRQGGIFFLKNLVVFEVLRIFQFLVFTSALWVLFVFANQQKEKNEMEVYLERLKIEHRSLQLSPHFVLNMLSQYAASILNLSKELYMQLSNFNSLLSYSYKSLDRANYLAHEVNALRDFLSCQRQRFGIKLQLIVTENLGDLPIDIFPIPKWVLMTLLENMFKHGNCFNPLQPCQVILRFNSKSSDSGVFTCILQNSLNKGQKISSTEFGIPSVRRILDFYFKENFQLFISESDEDFNLFLTITYYENTTNRPD